MAYETVSLQQLLREIADRTASEEDSDAIRLAADTLDSMAGRHSTAAVRAAFWKAFHESGEQWFNYLGTDEENDRSTESAWEEFLVILEPKSDGE